MTHYKGTYRLKAEIDRSTNMFPREYTGQFSDSDVYIDCQKGKIFHYGNRILEYYSPSKKRGHNMIKAIKENLGDDIIFHMEENDSEVIFRFNAKYMNDLEPYLKPKTCGSGISPYSIKNLPKTAYIIPDEDLNRYKAIVENLPQNRIIAIAHTITLFIKSLATKKNPYENIKADMALKGLRGKEYIHCIGQWDKFLEYLQKNI